MPKGGARKRPQMEIQISGMKEGERPFQFESTAEDLELSMFEGMVKVAGTLRKVSNQYFLRSDISGTFHGECDRCLAEVRREISTPMNIYYYVGVTDSEAGGDDAEMRTLEAEQDTIVLDDEVRQAIALEVPLKTLCRDECSGLCQSCGADLNKEECNCTREEIDPRWAKLADAFKKNDQN